MEPEEENQLEDFPVSSPNDGDATSVLSPPRNELVMDYTNHFTTCVVFESRANLLDWVRRIGVELGNVVVVKRSDVGRVTLACERSGIYRATKSKVVCNKKEDVDDLIDEEREEKKVKKRKTGTKKCNCPFLLMGSEAKTGGWTLHVISGVHNHPVSVDLTGHAYAGRLKREEMDLVDSMCDGNSRPKDILHRLKKTFEGNKSTMKTLYNYKMVKGIRDRAGKSQMQYLMSRLVEYEYRFFVRRCEETDTVRDIFYAHPTSVKLLHAFPHVLLIDCTYKTNQYKLPLMEMVGVTSTGKTFQIACAYLEKEREENYRWACSKLKAIMNQSRLPTVIITDRELALINAVEACFPTSYHLLCRWHINRNITANCKKAFRTKDAWDSFTYSWNVLVLADSEAKFNELIKRLQSDFAEQRVAVEYVMQQWIVPYKERFVSAWTNNIMHFSNSTTNRAESQHSVLKKQLGSSMGNFETCWAKIHTMLEVSHSEIQASFESSINVIQHRFKPNLFRHLRGVVSIEGLSKILEEIKGVPKDGIDQAACGCVIRRTCGLPCAHELFEFVRDDKPIPLDMVDSFWRKLDMSAPDEGEDGSVSADLTSHLEDALTVVKSKFDSVDEGEKRLLLARLREIGNPIMTTLLTPEGPVPSRGRPAMKKGKKTVDQSTKRDKSGFEYATSYGDSSSPIIVDGSQQSGDAPMFSKLPLQKKQTSAQTRAQCRIGLKLLPGNMHEHIVEETDVTADGHCGFRAISAQVFDNEESYSRVRADLMQEISSKNLSLYTNMFGEKYCSDMVDRINCFEKWAPANHWFDALDMGHLVANHYSVIFIVLCAKGNATYFPLTKEIPPNPKIIAIRFVNDCHFTKVVLREGHPLPTLSSMWYRYRTDCARGWVDAYRARLDMYQSTLSSNSATPMK